MGKAFSVLILMAFIPSFISHTFYNTLRICFTLCRFSHPSLVSCVVGDKRSGGVAGLQQDGGQTRPLGEWAT